MVALLDHQKPTELQFCMLDIVIKGHQQRHLKEKQFLQLFQRRIMTQFSSTKNNVNTVQFAVFQVCVCACVLARLCAFWVDVRIFTLHKRHFHLFDEFFSVDKRCLLCAVRIAVFAVLSIFIWNGLA